MKIIQMVPEGKRKPDGFMIAVTTDEAYRLMASIANQLHGKSGNVDREEFFSEDGLYFSVAVNFEEEYKERKLKLEAYEKLFRERMEKDGWPGVFDEAYGTELKERIEELDDKNNNKKRRKLSKTKK